jgi:hypothetical protein
MEILGNMYENPPSGVNKSFVTPYGPVGICSTPLTGADVRQAFVSWVEKNCARDDRKMPQSAMAQTKTPQARCPSWVKRYTPPLCIVSGLSVADDDGMRALPAT